MQKESKLILMWYCNMWSLQSRNDVFVKRQLLRSLKISNLFLFRNNRE
jgi:hypothetical protein